MSGRGRGARAAGGRGNNARGRGANASGRGRWNQQKLEEDNEERPPNIMGYRKLIEIKDRDPVDIVLTLISPKTGFRNLLQAQTLRLDWIGLILAIVKKACCQSVAQSNVNEIMSLTLNSTFFEEHVRKYITNMTTESSFAQQKTFQQPLIDLLIILHKMLTRMPKSYTSLVIPVAHVDFVIKRLRITSTIVNDEVEDQLSKVIELHNQLAERMREPSATPDEDPQLPPDDFREKSIFPVPEDLQETKRPYLRANKSKGTYENVEHYLDVQFRLLREDFVAPLRVGIHEYINQKKLGGRMKKLQDIRVYFDVQIINPICTPNGIAHRIKFDVSPPNRIRWESSRRLIFGSLVCLSKDNFTTLLFATVCNRKPENLANGELEIRFEENLQQVAGMSTEHKFVMAETSAYFEAYRHVLKGLQDTNEDNFPFKKYIINCQSDVTPPRYLETNPVFDLTALLAPNTSSNVESVPVFYKHHWPSAALMKFDESQLRAVQTALTKEFVIIQGPPGTGKTYIGLKIVQVLLSSKNKCKWYSTINPETGLGETKPILVVCYTNHALDQFLEGIQKFHDSGIVRVGGRSKSEKLEKYSLKNLRMQIKRDRKTPREVFTALCDARDEMARLRSQIDRVVAQIEATEKGIVHENKLENYIIEDHYEALMEAYEWMAGTKEASVMVDWLGLGHGIYQSPGMAMIDDENETADNGPEDQDDENDEIEIEDEAAMREAQQLDDGDNEFMTPAQARQLAQHNMLEQEASEALALKLDQLPNLQEQDGEQWQIQGLTKKKRKQRLQQGLQKVDTMTEREVNRIQNLWALNLDDRWRLYRYWINLYRNDLKHGITEHEQNYEQAAERLQEVKMQEDLAIMRDATIIGMTTTGAAKYRAALQQIKPKIVIVEEAAEVLEAHIVSALSEGCEHCILIGDHKQLKPSANVFELATKYNLEISLFERMINNGVLWDCLELQHRMRPEIATLMKPIYPELKNHESVLMYEDIRGVSGNLFFIDHIQPETSDDDLRSKSNEHEASFIVALCRYLILQGYPTEKITILTMYTGQLFKIRERMKPKEFFLGTRLTAVDNFQGEENDIILLSLVRSNEDNSIGFLSIENRVCVALSRAKKALYVIGNFTLLSGSTKTDLWSKLVGALRRENKVGKALPLYCQNHPDTEIQAETAVDFQKAPEGGCTLSCESRLSCGHVCPRVCHNDDQDHVKVTCMKPCEKEVCQDGHRCKKMCYQKCGNCLTIVDRAMPRCGHWQKMPCYETVISYVCKTPCNKFLDGCGHRCPNKCGESCSTKCYVMVKHTLPCKHEVDIFCYQVSDSSAVSCPAPCNGHLECDHICSGKCGRCRQGRLHIPCRHNCGRTLVCGHNCIEPCTSNCPPCKKKCENRCKHSKCQTSCGKSCVPCKEPCEWECPHYCCSKLCSEPCDRPRCNRPCTERLPCRHVCIGLCGEKCPSKCLVCNRDEVTEIFFGTEDEAGARFVQLEDCGHVFEVSGLDEWMAQKLDASNKIDIQLKLCPRCKTPIRRNLRYGTYINRALDDIEAVKRKVLGNEHEIDRKKIELLRVFRTMTRTKNLSRFTTDESDSKLNAFRELIQSSLSLEQLTIIENQLMFKQRIDELIKKVQEEITKQNPEDSSRLSIHLRLLGLTGRVAGNTEGDSECTSLFSELHELEDWILERRYHMGNQELTDFNNELLRMAYLVRYNILRLRHAQTKVTKLETSVALKSVKAILTSGAKMNDEIERVLKKKLKEIEHGLGGLGITDEERVQIVRAMGLNQGQWYKCPNGHVYAIGDCGGASVESNCPECKERIGGTGHRLLSSNALATEMDGARHSAWSEQANLENYHLEDL